MSKFQKENIQSNVEECCEESMLYLREASPFYGTSFQMSLYRIKVPDFATHPRKKNIRVKNYLMKNGKSTLGLFQLFAFLPKITTATNGPVGYVHE